MPYAIFSKRTRVINRIVEDLTSLLPSEGMIEVDEEINYPKETASFVQGQDVNTYMLPLFTEDGAPTTRITSVAYDGNGRPYTVKNPPRFIQPTIAGGDRQSSRDDLPIVSHPYGWKAEELFAVKYESILAQNFPYDVLIGEEFFDTTHIDTGASSDYVLTEGRCVIAPGGVVVTSDFKFEIQKELAATTTSEASRYLFDTYYLDMDPDPNSGVEVYWRGVRYAAPNDTTAWQPVIPNQEMPTSEITTSQTQATHMRSIQLRFNNLTSGVFALENYLLYLRLRKTVIFTP